MSEEEKKAIHLLQSYAGMTHKLTDNQGRPKLDQAIEKALNLIEKQQKEIEKLNKIIVMNKEDCWLAQNEVLGYVQGYEDGKQHKQTATAMIVENRKYEIIGEELKRYREIINIQQEEIEELKDNKIWGVNMMDREGKTIISINEYNELLKDLEKYKRIKETKPLAEAIERELKLLNIWA